MTSVRATIEALQTLGMSRVVILNPFEGYGKGIPDYVRNAGIDVVGMAALRETYHHDFETEPTAVAYRAARTLVKEHTGIDGLWITGASTPCASIIEDLEHDLGITGGHQLAGAHLGQLEDRGAGPFRGGGLWQAFQSVTAGIHENDHNRFLALR